MEEKKDSPEKKTVGRFSGMKSRNKKKGLKNRNVRRPNSAKKDLNDYQDKTRKDFLRRQVGESQEEWQARTKRKRVIEVKSKNRISLSTNGKMKAWRRDLKGKEKETKLNITARFLEKPFEYLNCYAFVMRWASIRFDILKDDLELGFYFFGGEPFTKIEFLQYCRMLGTVRGVFHRFWREGYIIPYSIMSSKGAVKDTEYFSLSIEFIMKIKQVYAVISKVAPMQLGTKHHRAVQNVELVEFLLKLNNEIEETILGTRNKDKILFRNDAEIDK